MGGLELGELIANCQQLIADISIWCLGFIH